MRHALREGELLTRDDRLFRRGVTVGACGVSSSVSSSEAKLQMRHYANKSECDRTQKEIRRADRILRQICREKPPIQSEGDYATLILFAKGIKTARAALELGEAGFGEDAISVLRTIYELLQHIAYINQDLKHRDERARLLDHEALLDR